MGYRSEIGVMVTMPKHVKYENVINRFRNCWNSQSDFDHCFDVKCNAYGGDRFVFIHTKFDLKWYEGTYDEVTKFMQVIRNWQDIYKSGGVHYVRIGESIEDLEEECRGNIEECVQIERSMYSPF